MLIQVVNEYALLQRFWRRLLQDLYSLTFNEPAGRIHTEIATNFHATAQDQSPNLGPGLAAQVAAKKRGQSLASLGGGDNKRLCSQSQSLDRRVAVLRLGR